MKFRMNRMRQLPPKEYVKPESESAVNALASANGKMERQILPN